ncbi:hypothetical protein KP509_30G049300 [Ceratopteris richardii]|uniref:RING-type E3 ubiquitin transferase n=1 Tax=Ceratopteris richardii TaxID=49495 RepID=A0A8T2R4D6_CERRI|nr:hypothetical protein KP509_30G049300 [Ceratopteris richardii]
MEICALSIAALILVLLLLLFMCWVHACARWRWLQRVRGIEQAAATQDPESLIVDGEEDDQQASGHKFAMLGLDQAAVQALPTFVYSGGDFGKDSEKDDAPLLTGRPPVSPDRPVECAVCLSEFSDGETCRRLPNCNHAFHIECIDTWLLASATCPVCRASCGTPASGPDVDPVSPTAAVQFPTNVLFWGNNFTRTLTGSTGAARPPIHQISAVHITIRSDSSASASGSASGPSPPPPPPTRRLSGLTRLRRLLSSENVTLLPSTSSSPKS